MKPTLHSRLSVLVVDNSAIIRQRLRGLLAESQCVRQVNEAASGAEAWRRFQQCAPEVVLLDIHLPDSSGLDLLCCIKRATPCCLVIVLTHLRDSLLRQETERRGADHFLHKATEFEQVADLLNQYAAGLIPSPVNSRAAQPSSPRGSQAKQRNVFA